MSDDKNNEEHKRCQEINIHVSCYNEKKEPEGIPLSFLVELNLVNQEDEKIKENILMFKGTELAILNLLHATRKTVIATLRKEKVFFNYSSQDPVEFLTEDAFKKEEEKMKDNTIESADIEIQKEMVKELYHDREWYEKRFDFIQDDLIWMLEKLDERNSKMKNEKERTYSFKKEECTTLRDFIEITAELAKEKIFFSEKKQEEEKEEEEKEEGIIEKEKEKENGKNQKAKKTHYLL